MDHGQTHQASLSNSNNPHDRNRFRTFSDEHDEPSTVDRVEDYEIAAKSADYDIHGAMVKPQSNKRNRTDDSTDTDETITTSSSSSSATTVRFEGLFEGSGYDDDSSRLDQPPEGRSGGNDVNSSLSDLRWIDRGSFARPTPDNHEIADSTTADLHLVAADSSGSSVGESDEDESNRDENSNIRDKRTENRPPVHGEKKKEDSSEEESSESTDHRTYTVAPSNSRLDTSYGGYEDVGVKRRSSSILEEKSIEELFDDNGWVITDQDLEKPGRAVGSKNGFEERPSPNEEKRETGSEEDRLEEETNSGNVASQSLSRSGGGKYGGESSIGKNGWMVSDESESESERAVSPMENSRRNEVSIEEDGGLNRDGSSSTAEESGKGGIGAENDSWTGDENGWVILNKVNDSSNGKEGESVDETLSTIRSQTTDLVARTNVENGALVANATQSKETESNCNEHEDTPGVDITIPMQMVTTVFCVSVLCYSVLINLFL